MEGVEAAERAGALAGCRLHGLVALVMDRKVVAG